MSLLLGCSQVSFEDNKRIQVKGVLRGERGAPLEQVPVSVETFIEKDVLSSIYLRKINETTTGPSGAFSFVALDVNAASLVVRINSEAENEFQSLSYYDPRPQREEVLFDLGNTILHRRTSIDLEFHPDDLSTGIAYEVNYPNQDPIISIGDWINFPELPKDGRYSKFLDGKGVLKVDQRSDRYRIRLHTLEQTEIHLSYDFRGNLQEDSPDTIIRVIPEQKIYEIRP